MVKLRIPPQAATALLVAASIGCATNPATGERQLSLISEAQEIQMGRDAARQVQQTLGFVATPALQDYVQRLGRQLAARSERPDLPWEFHVVDDPAQNAFALPGGFIYITRGMMNLLTSEAELASVLGHEIAHVTARHTVNQLSKQQLAQLGLGLGSVLVPDVQNASGLIGTAFDVLFLKYSRDDEREADEIGFRYVQQQGYAISEFDDVFAVLQRAGDEEASSLPGWLSTHPAPSERVAAARARAATVHQTNPRIGREAYLRQIDGLVFGKDPRNGFFRGNVFYHPRLRIQMQFPRGWQTQNLTQAVVAVAPGQSAMLELTLSSAPSSQAAFNQFAAQNGVSVGRPAPGQFNRLPGLSAEFVAQTQQGRIHGVVAFVEHANQVYQLAGYGPDASFAHSAPTLTSAIGTFGSVTDPTVLNVDPERIDIVQIQNDQTLGEFARRFPSTIPADELALINHLRDASASLDAGSLVKRVVS